MGWTATDGSLDVRTLQRAYENHEITPESLIDAVYARIEQDEHPHAFIHLISREEARAKARALGAFSTVARAAGDLPLFGVPFGVKDNIDVAGMPTTAACPGFSYLPTASAPSVLALEQAGAICLGKTNLDQFATGLVGSRSPYGTCRNVFNPDYLSGGSSSGSGVAVAAGYVSLALGTDTAGSGRVPAALNNIVGLKATRGLLSTSGVVAACQSLDCVSVFALSVADAVLARDLIKGGAGSAASIGPGFRFGVPTKLEWFGDSESEALFARAVALLESLGGRAVPVDFAPFRELGDLLYGPWVVERYLSVGAFIEAHPEQALPVTSDIILGAKRQGGAEVFRGLYERDRLQKACREQFENIELMVTPTVPTHYRLSEDRADPRAINDRLGTYTRYANFLDVPVLSVPAGFRKDGLPFGVSLVGHPGRDSELDALGALVHARSESGMGRSRTSPPAPSALGEGNAAPEARLAVVGAHLRGLPLHHQLTACNARFVRSVRTSPDYRLFVLPNSEPLKPGLVRVASGGHAIELEVFDLTWAELGKFMANVRAPLVVGTVRTETGEDVKCFLCEPYALEGAEDISAHGGFRSFLKARAELTRTSS